MPSEVKPKRRKIHIDLPEDIHQKLRVKAALEDMSMQAFVGRLVAEAVVDITIPINSKNVRKKESS